MITEPGQELSSGELHVGSRSVFAAAGFREVARPTLRWVVMRLDWTHQTPTGCASATPAPSGGRRWHR
jgi:hypothetical protein